MIDHPIMYLLEITTLMMRVEVRSDPIWCGWVFPHEIRRYVDVAHHIDAHKLDAVI
jgi:hypothetical protein